MINFALLGAGRIGKMHAKHIKENSNCKLISVFDINRDNAKEVADLYNSKVALSADEAILDKNVDAVFIASSTPTHINYIIKSAELAKPIFCEKPIDLDINKVIECYKKIQPLEVPIQIGFNRRFDKSNQKLKESKENGELGNLEMIVITSRDPFPSSLEYHKSSGGLFRDCTIHDFDLARFFLGNDPIIEISAFASQLFSEDIKKIGDYDTAMINMRSKDGVLIHINNSRRSVYGYDQRVEIFGSKGMQISNNQTPTSVEKYTEHGTFVKDPIHNFFIDRYEDAYKQQLQDFLKKLENGRKTSVTYEDGQIALILANSAYKSLEQSRWVEVEYI
tara:strand:- start:1016 stop:2020 length:1005 start_codon:yes stop_codon:yes gene_type:complete